MGRCNCVGCGSAGGASLKESAALTGSDDLAQAAVERVIHKGTVPHNIRVKKAEAPVTNADDLSNLMGNKSLVEGYSLSSV